MSSIYPVREYARLRIKDKFILISKLEIKEALAVILVSSHFVKARRNARLLTFLVNKTMIHTKQVTNEYTIGLEVFDKDPATYDTKIDCVVRVQIQRLRSKLITYYASLAIVPDIQITIPNGCYLPVITRNNGEDDTDLAGTDCLLPIKLLPFMSQLELNSLLMQSLNEELIHQLFKAFGKKFSLKCASKTENFGLVQGFRLGTNHLLTGSFRADVNCFRVSIRLLDVLDGQIVLSEQFDRRAYYSLNHQKELALTICTELKLFFDHAEIVGCKETRPTYVSGALGSALATTRISSTLPLAAKPTPIRAVSS